MRLGRPITVAALAATLVLVMAACGGGDGDRGSGGTIAADGSSTVGPFTTKAAEDFRAEGGADVIVGISGTGGGFERFCRGETDISNASRPIKVEEAAICADERIEYLELTVATDALTNVVNPENDWVDCLTVDQLRTIWAPGSKVESWSQVDPSYPDVPLRLYGAGTDSGTFDYFTDAIVGEEGASRTDYNPSEDDNVTIQGVEGDKGALGYFGFSYYEENADKLNVVAIDGGKGCVTPSTESAQDGTYTPLSRPLFIYPATSKLTSNPALKSFVDYYVENDAQIAEEALFIPLNEEQSAKLKSDWAAAQQ